MLADVDNAATSLIEGLQSGDNATNGSDSACKATNQFNLFKQSVSKVCRYISEIEAKNITEDHASKGSLPDGADKITSPAALTLTSQTDRGPKHLYSGLQKQQKNTLTDANTSNINGSSDSPKLDPGTFPNGITVTHVPPSNVLGQAGFSKQKRTFGEVFRPNRSLKALDPPRPSRNATRGSSLGWLNNEELTGTERLTPAYKSDYRYASLPTGSWLHYSSVEASATWAPDSKRRQKDRALSFGESRSEPSEEASEYEQVRSKALFQSAYSSFAPSLDNSTAVVAEETRSRAWWNKVGQKRFQALFAVQYPESDLEPAHSAIDSADHAEEDFEAAVTTFAGDPPRNPSEAHGRANADPKEVNEVLEDISDLIQTLSSFQRIRNLSKINSGPGNPSAAETEVYEILRSNLSILVDSLPPYAVAKLNGDQLEMLNVSTNIAVDIKDHVGTMELDQYSVQRQRASIGAGHPTTGRSGVSLGAAGRPGSYSAQSTSYNQRPGYSGAPRTSYGSQPRAMATYGGTGAAQAQSFPAARPAPMAVPRPGFSAQQHHPTQSYTPKLSAPQYQRSSTALQNGYGPGYGNQDKGASSQATVQRQGQGSYSYSLGQSPQKPGQGPQPVAQASPPQGSPQKQQPSPSQQSQTSPTVALSGNSQAITIEHARTSLQPSRNPSATPQTPNFNGQYARMVRSSTPGGGTLSGRPVVAASGGVQ